MNGGYGPNGYPGQDYDGEGPGEDGQGWDRRQPRDGSLWRGDQGYASYDTPGYGSQDFDAPAYGRQGYGSPGYGGEAYGEPGYGEPGYGGQGYGTQGQPGYPAQPGQPGQGGTGSQRAMRGSGGMGHVPPGYDPRVDRSRRMNPGYEQRDPGYGQGGGYDEWGQEQSDSSFLPGFGQGSGSGGGDRYAGDYGDRRGQGTGAGTRGPAGRGQGGQAGRGPGGPGAPGQRLREDGRRPREDDRRPREPWDDGDGRGGRYGQGGGSGDRPSRKATRWIPRILIAAIVAAILVGGGTGGLYIYHKYQARYHPADYAGQGTGDLTVQVPNGATAFSLAPELVQLGVVASERAFTNAAENATSTTGANSAGLEAGYFQLHHHMQASLAYAALVNPKNRVQTTVTIPEGKRVSQVLTILAAHTKIPLSQFEAAARQTSKLGLPPYAGTTAKLPSTVKYGQLEGYLFPATYAVVPHETALQILQAMVQRYNVEAEHINIATAAKSVGLTPRQLIIEASMVQAEAGINADMPKMARVIINRKAHGMPDGFSSVDFYGLGKYGINLTNSAEAQSAGLYDNTQQLGLPPTPIDNPGDAAIQAVLHPAPGPWLYFVTTAVGKPTQFSATCFQATCGG